MNDEKKLDPELEELLSDKDIMNFFKSRDPDRPKPNPFLTNDEEKKYSGKASKLKTVEETPEEKNYGVSYSEHERHAKQIALRFFNLGLMSALIISIVTFLIIR